jgi:hypothetical protein
LVILRATPATTCKFRPPKSIWRSNSKKWRSKIRSKLQQRNLLRPLFACGPYPSARDPASSHAALPTCAVHTRSPPLPMACTCAAASDGRGELDREVRWCQLGVPEVERPLRPSRLRADTATSGTRPEAASRGARLPARSASCAWAFRRPAASMARGASSVSGRGELPPWLVRSGGASGAAASMLSGEAALAVQAPHPSASRRTSCRLASSQQAKLFQELGNVGLGTDESSRPGSAASCCSKRHHASTIIKLQNWEFFVLVIDGCLT